MAIQISQKSQQQIEELVASGRYADAQDVLTNALALLTQEERKMAWLEEQLAEAREEDERGLLIPFDAEIADRRIREAIERYKTREPNRNVTES